MISNIGKKIKSFFLTNTNSKVVAILVAMVLWVFVASSQSTAGKFPGKLPVKAVNVANGLVAIYDQKEVEIEITAKPDNWNKLTSSSFSAYVDMEGAQIGTYEMNVQVVSNVSDVKIISKNPAKIFVRIEEVVSKKVNVNQRIDGNAAEGLIAGNVLFTPAEVNITGPRSVIENVSEAVAIIQLNGESADFEKSVTVKAFGADGGELTEVSLNPNKVTSKISIVKGTNNKSVGIKVNLSGNPKDGYFVSKITTNPNTINITGQSSALLAVNYLETQNIDISGASSNIEKDVSLKVPDGVALQRGEPTRVKVALIFSESDISRSINPRVEIRNLNPSLRLDSYTPSVIEVILSGKPSVISTLNPADVVLELDMTSKGAGSFDFPISSSAIQPIAGVAFLSLAPSSIQITLVNR